MNKEQIKEVVEEINKERWETIKYNLFIIIVVISVITVLFGFMYSVQKLGYEDGYKNGYDVGYSKNFNDTFDWINKAPCNYHIELIKSSGEKIGFTTDNCIDYSNMYIFNPNLTFANTIYSNGNKR